MAILIGKTSGKIASFLTYLANGGSESQATNILASQNNMLNQYNKKVEKNIVFTIKVWQPYY